MTNLKYILYVPKIFWVYLGAIAFLSGCGGIGVGVLTEESPPLSVVASTDRIVEGQQARVKIILAKALDQSVNLSWVVKSAQDSSMASTLELSEVYGALTIPAGEKEVAFYLSSLPASLNVNEKYFRLEVSEKRLGGKVDYSFAVVKNLGNASVSVAAVANNSYVNASNKAAYAVSGTCSHPQAYVALAVGMYNLTTLCQADFSWSASLDLTTVSDGALALVVNHAPDESAPAMISRSLIKDTVIPTLAVTSPATSTQIGAGNAASFPLEGACSENGRTVTLSAVSDAGAGEATGTALCSAGGWSAILNLEFLANGNVTVTAHHTDVAGNVKDISYTYIKDAAVPVFSITMPVSDQIYNSLNYTAVSVSGACSKAGAAITLSGAVTGSTTCDGTQWSLSGLTLSGADGNKTISAAILDSAGNASSINVVVKKYTSKPTAALINVPTGTNNATGLNVIVQVPLSLNGKYKYKIGDKATTQCNVDTDYSAETSAAVNLTGAIGTDGEKRLCVVAIDDYGNQQNFTSATAVEWTKKTSVPVVALTSHGTGQFVNQANQSAFAISGSCSESGRDVTIAGSVAVQNVSCSGANTWSAVVNFSAQPDGIVGLFISQSDTAGNIGQDSKYFNKDTALPSVTLDTSATIWINRANRGDFQISGTCSDYSDDNNIEITGGDGAVNVKCSGLSGWSGSTTFTGAGNGGATGAGTGTRTLTVKITDAAGNTAQTTKVFNIKTTEPTVAISTPVAASYVNDTTKAAVAVTGTCSDNGVGNIELSASKDTVTVTKTLDCAALAFDTSVANKLDLTSLTDGDIGVTAKITDVAGNEKVSSIVIKKKITYPGVDWTTPVAGVCVGPGNKTGFPISGVCSNGSGDTAVTVSSAALTAPVNMTCVAGTFGGNLNIDDSALSNGATITINISQSDIAGNIKTESRTFKYLASGQTPTITFGGWDDVYAVGVKTYADKAVGVVDQPSEPGVVRFNWKAWPAGNTCQPEVVSVYRSVSSGQSLSGSKINTSDILSHVREFKDETLAGSTVGTVSAPTDFGKAWYYGLKVKIAGIEYEVDTSRGGQELRIMAPPENMTLVHRWIANQETCGLMGRTSDKANNYRCNYSGWGRSYGDATKFDMEYDMLVDRNTLACNYTVNCGPHNNQACVTQEFPDDTLSTINAPIGAVFYYNDVSLGQCYVKTAASTWVAANSLSTVYTTMATNKAHRPPLISVSQTKSADFCAAHTAALSINGVNTTPAKRLLRNKEWKAAAAWSPQLTDAQIVTLENGGLGRCNSSSRSGLGDVGTVLPGASGNLKVHGSAILTGSLAASINCQSRYGVQDMVGNVWEWVSDQMESCSVNGLGCVGRVSSLDAGNTDMKPGATGFAFDHTTMGPGGIGVGSVTFEQKNFGSNYFSIPLGLPMRSNDSGNAIAVDDWLSPTNKFHGDYISLGLDNGNTSRGLFLGGNWSNGSVAGRWASNWFYAPSLTVSSIGARCGLPVQY